MIVRKQRNDQLMKSPRLLFFALIFLLIFPGCLFTPQESPSQKEEPSAPRLPTSDQQNPDALIQKIREIGETYDSLTAINVTMQSIDPSIDLVKTFTTNMADADTTSPQQQIIDRAQNVISQVNALEQQISPNANIEQGLKEETIEVLNTIEKILLQYSSDLQTGKDAENFQNIYDGIVTFLTNVQESLRDNLNQILVDLAKQESVQAAQALSTLKDSLDLARKNCPSVQQNIFDLESLARQLQSENDLLQTANETANIADSQERGAVITAYVSEIYENLKIIVQNCQN